MKNNLLLSLELLKKFEEEQDESFLKETIESFHTEAREGERLEDYFNLMQFQFDFWGSANPSIQHETILMDEHTKHIELNDLDRIVVMGVTDVKAKNLVHFSSNTEHETSTHLASAV